VCAFNLGSTKLSLYRVYSSRSIINYLCACAFEPRSTQLNLSRVTTLGTSLVTYVCLHLNLGVHNWASLGFSLGPIGLGASSMSYVCVHLSLGVPNWTPLGFGALGALGASLMAYVYAFEPRSTQLSLYGVCNSWSIINNLCVCAFEPRNTQLNFFRVYSSFNINNGLCVYAFEPRNTQLNLYGVCCFGTWLNGLCVYAFELGT
jgi:hypothetical protein